jgi:hypothetical protein
MFCPPSRRHRKLLNIATQTVHPAELDFTQRSVQGEVAVELRQQTEPKDDKAVQVDEVPTIKVSELIPSTSADQVHEEKALGRIPILRFLTVCLSPKRYSVQFSCLSHICIYMNSRFLFFSICASMVELLALLFLQAFLIHSFIIDDNKNKSFRFVIFIFVRPLHLFSGSSVMLQWVSASCSLSSSLWWSFTCASGCTRSHHRQGKIKCRHSLRTDRLIRALSSSAFWHISM